VRDLLAPLELDLRVILEDIESGQVPDENTVFLLRRMHKKVKNALETGKVSSQRGLLSEIFPYKGNLYLKDLPKSQ
jgi:hypothetical protein